MTADLTTEIRKTIAERGALDALDTMRTLTGADDMTTEEDHEWASH